jgi:hypothetical protein
MTDRENPDPELESVLREAGREMIAEAAEDERLTELLRRRRQSLADLALEWVHRGQWVRAELGSQTFSGRVVFAGSDFLTLEREEDHVAIPLHRATWTLEPDSTSGSEQLAAASSLKARLAELESTGEVIRLLVGDGRALVGSVAVVAADQVEISQDRHSVMVPLEQVGAVIIPRAMR